MVFPTVTYSTKINSKLNQNKSKSIAPNRHPKVGTRHAPNIYDRIAAYDRAFQRCMKMDSKLSSWRRKMEQKGLPKPLMEGYKQKKRQSICNNNHNNNNNNYNNNYNNNNNSNHPSINNVMMMDIPTPKPSVSRRIINRLSSSKSTLLQNKKVSPIQYYNQQQKKNSSKSSSNVKNCKYVISSPILINTPLPPLPPTPPPHKIFNYSSSSSITSSTTTTSIKNRSSDQRNKYLRASLIVPNHCALDDTLLHKRHSDVLSHYNQPPNWR
ncbi:unnamed protein product [Cunninghamella blakesleeana]